MLFDKELLIESIYDRNATVYDRVVGNGRWSVHHERVFSHEGRFYRTTYSVGATESQDESPYDYQPDMVECEEVFPRNRVVVVYETETESALAVDAVDPHVAK